MYCTEHRTAFDPECPECFEGLVYEQELNDAYNASTDEYSDSYGEGLYDYQFDGE